MICGLDLLASEYAAIVTRAQMAEDQLAELQDLICAYLEEGHPGALDFLKAVAADHHNEYVKRRAAGKSIVDPKAEAA